MCNNLFTLLYIVGVSSNRSIWMIDNVSNNNAIGMF